MALLGRYLLGSVVAVITLTAVGFIVAEAMTHIAPRELPENGNWFDDPHFHRSIFYFVFSGLLYSVIVGVICLPLWLITSKIWPFSRWQSGLLRGAVLFAAIAMVFFILGAWDNFTRFEISPFSAQTLKFAVRAVFEIGLGAVLAGGMFGLTVSSFDRIGRPV